MGFGSSSQITPGAPQYMERGQRARAKAADALDKGNIAWVAGVKKLIRLNMCVAIFAASADIALLAFLTVATDLAYPLLIAPIFASFAATALAATFAMISYERAAKHGVTHPGDLVVIGEMTAVASIWLLGASLLLLAAFVIPNMSGHS
jgi:hypothetical protein